jgi:hypothetical protein
MLPRFEKTSATKRSYTKGEALALLDQYDRNFTAAATHLCEEFLGGAVDEASSAKIEKLTKTINRDAIYQILPKSCHFYLIF